MKCGHHGRRTVDQPPFSQAGSDSFARALSCPARRPYPRRMAADHYALLFFLELLAREQFGGSRGLAASLPTLTNRDERHPGAPYSSGVATSHSTMMAIVFDVPFIHCDEPASGPYVTDAGSWPAKRGRRR